MNINYKDVEAYQRDGFLLVENLFSQQEVDRMLREIESGKRIADTTFGVADSTGKTSKVALWSELGDGIWDAASTSPRILNIVRVLLGQEVSFFHAKVMLKEAKTGGAWEWHQDYGYWYNQFLFPHLITCFTALDPCIRENGCLRVLKGSHKLGRLEHEMTGQQTGAKMDRIELIEDMFETVECIMSPGSVLFTDSNLLHTSSANLSDKHRRTFVMCYNALSNPKISNGKIVYGERCPTGSDDAIMLL